MEQTSILAALQALSQEHRLEAFRLLAAAGYAGLAAGELAQRLGIPSNTLSFHLERLRQARLVASERRGRSLVYSARFDTMEALIGYLSHDCCSGRPELCGGKAAPRGRRLKQTEAVR